MATGPVPLPIPGGGQYDQVARMEDVLRTHPGWSVRYDGMLDKFVAWREDGDGSEDIIWRELRDVLDVLERLP